MGRKRLTKYTVRYIRNSLIRLKKNGLVTSIQYYFLKFLCFGKYVPVKRMMFLPNGCEIRTQQHDYVRFASLELIADEINRSNIEGDVAELGIYQGKFSCEINRAFPDKSLYLFDTFDGFDGRDSLEDRENKYSSADEDFSYTNIESILNLMPYRDKCIVKKGWFPETTIGLEEAKFVFVSIDADLFKPIFEGLEYFYPRLTVGGGYIYL